MNIFNQIKILPSLLMNSGSSAFLASDNVVTSVLSADNLLTRILRVFFQIMYFACKWIMYIVDVIYFYILQLAGVNTDVSIFDSSNTDMTLQFLVDNKEIVTKILKNLIVLAIIIILITAIVAIIKQQYASMKDENAKGNGTKTALSKILKSVMLLILTPLVAIFGIIASNVILKGLFNATKLSQPKSISATVFNASASSANRYRVYAQNGVRIPVVYKFSGDTKKDAIKYTTQMVGNESYPNMKYFDEKQTFIGGFYDPVLDDVEIEASDGKTGREVWLNDTYYTYYDSSSSYSPTSTGKNKYRCLGTHENEYYTMSDVITYALDTMEEFYIITVEKWIDSLSVLDASEQTKIQEDFNVEKSNGVITYKSTYASGEYEYGHVIGERDEIEGAKFIIAYIEEDENNSKVEQGLYGDKILTSGSGLSGTYEDIETFYLKKNTGYKKVDLYYTLNSKTGEYLKVAEKDFKIDKLRDGEYYYQIGADYYKIDANAQEFFYKNGSNYVQLDLKGAVDEGNIDKLKIFFTVTKISYYMPLTSGSLVDGSTTFRSNYFTSGLITARGIFDTLGNPTAIRETSQGKILFYRDNLELVTLGSSSDFANIDQIEAEEDDIENEGEGTESSNQGFWSKVGSTVKKGWNSVKNFVSSIFNPLRFVPDLTIDESKITTTYTKKTTLVTKLEDSKLHLSYFFSDSITSKLSSSMYGLNLNYLFEPININWIVLVVGSISIFKIMTTALFGLINRVLNLAILFMIYPVACSTIPLDEADDKTKAKGYAKWKQKFTQLLFGTYGLILSLNFVFVIISALDKIEFFKEQDFVSNIWFARLGNALLNPWLILDVFKIGVIIRPNYSLICWFMNKLMKIIFEIVAFSLVTSANGKGGDSFYSVIQTVVGTGSGVLEDSPIDAVKKTLKSMTKTVNTMLFPGKAIKDTVVKSGKKLKEVAVDMVPGSAVLKEGVNKYVEIKSKMGDPKAMAMKYAKAMTESSKPPAPNPGGGEGPKPEKGGGK